MKELDAETGKHSLLRLLLYAHLRLYSGNSLGIRVRHRRRHTLTVDPDLAFTPDTTYVFNPCATTHYSKCGIPFDLPYPRPPPNFNDATFTVPQATSPLTYFARRCQWKFTNSVNQLVAAFDASTHTVRRPWFGVCSAMPADTQ